jgi:hypothetical protein
MGNVVLYQGTTSVVPQIIPNMSGFSPWGTSFHAFACTKTRFENRTSAAKAVPVQAVYGTAEAVPFVQPAIVLLFIHHVC